MYRYLWEALQDDGTVIERWGPSGEEYAPDPWRTRQFHLFSLCDANLPTLRLFIPKGAHFVYLKRRLLESSGAQAVIYVTGWVWPDGPSCYWFLAPDGSLEMSADLAHQTRFEREPLPNST